MLGRSWSQRSGINTSELHDRLPLISLDELRRLPQDVGLLAYRNRRGVLLDLTAWDARRDSVIVQAAKRDTEATQHEVFAQRYLRHSPESDSSYSEPTEDER